MASKLCCTTEQDDRSSSLELPNARINEATPARRPLLQKRIGSQGSRFTSARSEDLHELREIFNNAKDPSSKETSPTKSYRSRFTRSSAYSLRSLHRIKSVHALVKRKLSKDLPKSSPNAQVKSGEIKNNNADKELDTVIKMPRDQPNLQLKITKADLRKDLLSDKKPEEGGYDADAEVLDDVAKKMGKRTPSKRPSIHSIDWTSSPSSKPSPESAKEYETPDHGHNNLPYQLNTSKVASRLPGPSRFSQISSSPNLLFTSHKSKDRNLRRSHSAASIKLPQPSPLSPIRLPSISADEIDAVPWSIATHESLRLSEFPLPPSQPNTKHSRSSLRVHVKSTHSSKEARAQHPASSRQNDLDSRFTPEPNTERVEIHVQEPTESPRVSSSIRAKVTRENARPPETTDKKVTQVEEEENSRQSIHLYSMRISQHLRSGSLLSWDQLADAPDLPTPPRIFHERSASGCSRVSQLARRSRHDRQSSSSGFASSKVPSKWGRVVVQSAREEMSSVYSSRPHSPPDSFGGSVENLSLTITKADSSKSTAIDLTSNHSDNSPTDNEKTPKRVKRYGITNLQAFKRASAKDSLLSTPVLARNNSVGFTKRSKFREEFSPSPPRKKTPSISIMKILRPRSNIRSQSEANLKAATSQVDGQFDADLTPTKRERRLSQSLISLQKEQQALGKDKGAGPIWEKALKTYQDERSSLLLPTNKDLAKQASPFRERSGSFTSRPKSISSVSPTNTVDCAQYSSTASQGRTPTKSNPDGYFQSDLSTRRSALAQADKIELSPVQEAQAAFDKQMDTTEIVGAWGRYPSHTRKARTSSAGHLDSVQTRDFALEAAIRFAKGEDSIDPTTRLESPPMTRSKRKKKRVGSDRMAKSHSMTFGKTFLKNYTKIFRSQSTEFQRHGHGHRSSVATGGTLEYPELEILPDVWRRAIVEDTANEQSRGESSGQDEHHEAELTAEGKSKNKGKEKQRADESMATLRPKKDDSKDLGLDGITDKGTTTTDRAKVWSVYYEDCIPDFPRISTDFKTLSQPNLNELIELKEFGGRHSFDSRRASMHSRTFPTYFKHHSRHGSRVSRASIASRGSIVPSFRSMGDGGEASEELSGVEGKSMVSVRRSTMDLVTLYRKQEVTERERVLSLMRIESVKNGGL